MTKNSIDWRSDIYSALRTHNIQQVCHVPDAGHAALIRNCEADNGMTVVGLTEEDGVGVLTGTWLGGTRGGLLMQSGVGNTINALACRTPAAFRLLQSSRCERMGRIRSMIPMGRATPDVFEAMGVTVLRADGRKMFRVPLTPTKMAFDSNGRCCPDLPKDNWYKDFRAEEGSYERDNRPR